MKGRSAVNFENTVPPVCDIFFSSGTLQFLEHPMEVLASGFASAQHAVVLARNSFCDEELFRVQRTRLFMNGSGPVPPGYVDANVTYPHRTINEGTVKELAGQHGFRCVTRIEEDSGVLPYLGKVYGKQLVFTR
jgi:hypothetical protein